MIESYSIHHDVTLLNCPLRSLSRALLIVLPVVLPHSKAQHKALTDVACLLPISFTNVSYAESTVEPRPDSNTCE